MRTILVALFLGLFFIISIPLFAIEYIIGKFNKRMQAASSQVIVRAALKFILFVSGVKVEASGMENVPKDEAVLYVANHRSYFDILLGYTTVPTLTGFVSKIEMSRVPFIRTWMRFLNCLFLDRDNLKEGLKTILKGIEQIKEGYSVFIMPEGTRNQKAEMLPFHEGSFKLAQKSGCAIIPVAIYNTEEGFENYKPWIHKANTAIRYGEPIYIKDLEKENQKFVGAYVQNIIAEMLAEIQGK